MQPRNFKGLLVLEHHPIKAMALLKGLPGAQDQLEFHTQHESVGKIPQIWSKNSVTPWLESMPLLHSSQGTLNMSLPIPTSKKCQHYKNNGGSHLSSKASASNNEPHGAWGSAEEKKPPTNFQKTSKKMLTSGEEKTQH